MSAASPIDASTQVRDKPSPGVLAAWRRRWRVLLAAPLAAGIAAFAGAPLLPAQYEAAVLIRIPKTASPQAGDGQSVVAADVFEGTSLSGTADQYASLLAAEFVRDHLVDRFGLRTAYAVDGREEARKKLAERTAIDSTRTDGLMRISVRDTDPQRAAAIANRYADELGLLIDQVSIGAARRRQAFFGDLLAQARTRTADAQQALQRTGIAPGTLKAEPGIAASGYDQLARRLAAAEVALQALRATLTDAHPDVMRQKAEVDALRAQAARVDAPPARPPTGYVREYREYAYQQALYTVFQRQYDTATVDVARGGPPVEVVDPARAPRLPAWPRRGRFALGVALMAGFVAIAAIALAGKRRAGRRRPGSEGAAP